METCASTRIRRFSALLCVPWFRGWLCCLACWPILGERPLSSQNSLQLESSLARGQPIKKPERTLAGDSKIDQAGEVATRVLTLGLIADGQKLSQEYSTYMNALKHPPVYAGPLTPECHTTVHIDSMMQASSSCPARCRWLAEERNASNKDYATRRGTHLKHIGCRFQCVSSAECGAPGFDPESRVADTDDYVCRHCSIAGCLHCVPGNDDACQKDQCAVGYYWSNFRCISEGRVFFKTFFAVFGALAVVLLLWYFDLLFFRPAVNMNGLLHGLRFRMRTKLRQPRANRSDRSESTASSASGRDLYPLTTNLQRSGNANIAGPGTILHFNFLLALTLWPGFIGGLWFIAVKCSDPLLFVLGTLPATTPAQLCAVLNWGYAVQRYYIKVKVWFLFATYVISFIGSIVYSAVQLRRFHRMNQEITSMQDFACLIEGLEVSDGKATAEENTKEFLEKITGQSLIGVSLCWNYLDHEEELMDICHQDVRDQEMQVRTSARGAGSTSPTETPNLIRQLLSNIDDLAGCLFSGNGRIRRPELTESDRDAPPDDTIKDLLQSLRTSGYALAVFQNEACRDAAVEASAASGGFEHEGDSGAQRVHFRKVDLEPDTVLWQNFGYSKDDHVRRLFIGITVILLTQLAWAVLFYLPYSYYILAFSYAHGEEPDFASSLVFTLLVVAGNQLMYFVSMTVATKIGYVSSDHKEACYSVLYTAANITNVVVDLAITGFLSYRILLGQGIFLGDRPFSSLESISDILESYPMQNAMGSQLWLYNFPSTFLVPYIMEPIFAIAIPRHLVVLLVRATRTCVGADAEQALSIFTPMDIGRYADLIVNMTLAVLAFFGPAGYTLQTFAALALCHLYIYWYDHYRVLRCVPAFWYSNYSNEILAQALLSIPCALILAALIFKANCLGNEELRWGDSDSDTITCLHDTSLYMLIGCSFALHVALHLFIVWKVLPWCTHVDYETSKEDYASVAARLPSSWFNTNPVHCLRSKYIHDHCPPCYYHIQGLEHALAINPKINCYFEEDELPSEK